MRTNRDGSFELSLTSPLPASLVASARGYAPGEQALGDDAALVISFVLLEMPTSALDGLVEDATGGPVPGARVASFRASDVALSAPIEVTEADVGGRFSLSLVSGDWVVTARAEGYSTSRRRVSAPAKALTLVLAPASSIRGRVVEEAGQQPVAGVVVRAARHHGVQATPELASTGADGSFDFEALTAGSYLVLVATDRYRSDPRVVEVGLNDSADDVELSVYAAVTVGGVVSFDSGSPCRAGNVQLQGPLSLVGDIREDGNVRIDGVPAGAYQVLVTCEGGRPLAEEIEVGVAPVQLEWRVEEGLALSGSVERASGSPYAGARVLVVRRGSDSKRANSSAATPTFEPARVVAADADGNFRVPGLAEGNYTVQLLNGMEQADSAADVFVAAREPNRVNLIAPASGAIQVSLPDLDESARDALQVFATHRESGKVARASRADGFVFAGLPLGTYRVSLEPCGGAANNPATGTAEISGRACQNEAVELTLERDGQLSEARLPLDRRHVIEGRVVDERGAPVPDAWVWAEHDFVAPSSTNSDTAVLSDPEGAFRLSGLSSGRHVLQAKSPAGEATGVVAESGSRSTVLRIERFGDISGSVQTRAGRLASGFQVEYVHETGSGGAVVATRGRFDLPRLRPGRYHVTVTSAEGADGQSLLLEPGAQIQASFVLTETALEALAAPDVRRDGVP